MPASQTRTAQIPAPSSCPVRVWLIEDNIRFRRSVSRMLSRLPELSFTGEFSSLEEALPQLNSASAPEVILLDIGLPGLSGLQGLPLLHEKAPRSRIVILTVFDDSDRIFKAICHGASGYLLKTLPVPQLAQAILEAAAGGAPMNPGIAKRVLEKFAQLTPPRSDYGLTDRERAVLELLVDGFIMKEIAERLAVSYHTVDTHLRNIYQKLHVHTRGGAVAKAVKEGII